MRHGQTGQPLGAPTYASAADVAAESAKIMDAYRDAMVKANPANQAQYDSMDAAKWMKLFEARETRAKTAAEQAGAANVATIKGGYDLEATHAKGRYDNRSASISAQPGIMQAQVSAQQEQRLGQTAVQDRNVKQTDRNDAYIGTMFPTGSTNKDGAPEYNVSKSNEFKRFTDEHPTSLKLPVQVPVLDAKGRQVKGLDGQPKTETKVVDANTDMRTLGNLPDGIARNLISQRYQQFQIKKAGESAANSVIGFANFHGGDGTITDAHNGTTSMGHTLAERGGMGIVNSSKMHVLPSYSGKTVVIGGNEVPLETLYYNADGNIDIDQKRVVDAEYNRIMADKQARATDASGNSPAVAPAPMAVASQSGRTSLRQQFGDYNANPGVVNPGARWATGRQTGGLR